MPGVFGLLMRSMFMSPLSRRRARWLAAVPVAALLATAAGVDAVDADEITLSTLDPMKPAVVRPVGRDDYLYLLMPVRVP